MSKRKAPTSLTGGKGFGYEDYVAARFLVDMLQGSSSLGTEFGRVQRVDWQATDSDRKLDDLVVTLESSSATHVAECSVKMARQVTRKSFAENFVVAIWEQWLETDTNSFDKDNDIFVLVCKNLADSVISEWQRLLAQAIATATQPSRLLRRLENATKEKGNQTSQVQRSLFESLKCPPGMTDGDRTSEEVATQILQRIRLRRFDFKSNPSEDERRAIIDCQSLVQSGHSSDAKNLWDRLVFLSYKMRDDGGTLEIGGLLRALRGEFDLLQYPDHRGDWENISSQADDFFDDVSTDVGSHACLVRTDEINGVQQTLVDNRLCILGGSSGSGKSAVTKIVSHCHFDSRAVVRAECLQSGSRSNLQDQLHLKHDLVTLLRSCTTDCLLVFDAFERASDEGIRLAGRLIADILNDENCRHVKILVTTIDDAMVRVVAALTASGEFQLNENQFRRLSFPSEQDVLSLVVKAPGLAFQNLHGDLKPLLRNLKILDWVLHVGKSGAKLDSTTASGLISLIDYLWSSWVEVTDDSIARSGLLKRLGDYEAASYADGVPLDQFDTSQHQILRSLVSTDCVRIRNENVRFSHDLLGDWARLKLLVGDDPTRTKEARLKASQTRWHRAVRLFGRWLCSRPNGGVEWAEAVGRVDDGSTDGTIIRDLLLESIVVAENSFTLMEQVWTTLTENNGVLLRQLLHRFMIVGTVPDMRFVGLFAGSDLRAQLEATNRLPDWPYWIGVIGTLRRHTDDMVRFAPIICARICHLWLSKTPVKDSSGSTYPARSDVSRLAVEIARDNLRKLASEEWFERSDVQTIYEALLQAAYECPDDVEEIALQLAQRRPPTPEMQTLMAEAEKARQVAEMEKQNDPAYQELLRYRQSAPFHQLGKRREPWPDGPSERLPNGFQEAVLSTSAILPLADCRPDAAVELLLAASIEDPQYEDWSGGSELTEDCGVASWDEGYPPIYARGPFLLLLRRSPEAGLEFAIRLINFATKRILDTEFEKYSIRQRRLGAEVIDQQRPCVELNVDGATRVWFGEDSVFRWHTECSLDRKLVPCLLMAVEKWLEELIEEGKDISSYLAQIMSQSESVAFAGLLISVAKRKPDILQQELMPLLTVLEFYFWDRHAVHSQLSTKTWSIAWAYQDHVFASLARKWHTAEHRRVLFTEMVQALVYSSEELQPIFKECRERWAMNIGHPPDLTLQSFIEMFDPANYSMSTDDDGNQVVMYRTSKELAQKLQKRKEELEEPYPRMMYPIECRTLLDAGEPLSDEKSDNILAQAKVFAGQEGLVDEAYHEQLSAIAGGLAVLTKLSLSWLCSDEHRLDWCEQQLELILRNPAARTQFQSPESSSQWSWESFACEAALRLMAAGRGNPVLREFAARGVVAFHYETISRIMLVAFQSRESLGQDFDLLQYLSIRWSVGRRSLEYASSRLANLQSGIELGFKDEANPGQLESLETHHELLKAQCDRLVKEFVDATLSPIEIHAAVLQGKEEQLATDKLLEGTAPVEPEPSPAPPRKRHRRKSLHREAICLDLQVLSAGYCWLGTRDAWRERRDDALQSVTEFRNILIESLPSEIDGDGVEVGDWPTGVDSWMFEMVSRGTCLLDDPTDASLLWKPIVTLEPHLHRWIERFFWSWFDDGVLFAPNPQLFAERWKQMIELAGTLPAFDPLVTDERIVSDLVFSLLGLKYPNGRLASDEAFQSSIKGLSNTLRDAADRWMHLPTVANHFAAMLIQPAYANLLVPGVTWIAKSLDKAEDDFWRSSEIESRFVSLLNVCWERHADEVKRNPELRGAFEKLLTTIAARGDFAATTLRDRLLDSFARLDS